MRSVHLENGIVTVRDVPVPVRQPGQALIRLLTAGICSTDLHLQRGYYGFAGTPGHEFVGEVIASDDPAWIGQHVVGEINLACGTCTVCRKALGRHCPNRTVLGIVKHPGAFAEYLTLPQVNLHRVPEGVPLEHAVFVEPIAAACEILDQVSVWHGVKVAVLGDGKLGLLIAQVLQLHGARVHLYGRHPEKIAAVAPLGVVPGQPGATFAFVVDATGTSAGLEQAVAMTRPRGTLIMKSTVHDKVLIDTAPIIVNELTLVGSRCGRFEPALELLAAGRLILEPLIADRFPLEQAPQAFARASEKGVLKVLLQP